MKTGFSVYLVGAGLLGMVAAVGCQTQKGGTSDQKSLVQLGKAPFRFEVKDVLELVLLKSDPNQGDHWNLTLNRKSDQWKISYGSTEKPYLDQQADETFILHLLDTFKTLKIEQDAPNGPLESFGLNPPHFAIRWKTAEKEFEFRLGASLQNGRQRYFTLDGKKVWIASGAAIRMLAQITSSETLRKHTWMYTDADDVDEIELRHQGKLFLYAQREGDRWTDRKNQLIRQDMNSFVNMMTKAQVQQFIDDPTKVEQVQKQLNLPGNFSGSLIDRSGKRTELTIIQKQGVIYGQNSTRPSSIFVLKPTILENLHNIKNKK